MSTKNNAFDYRRFEGVRGLEVLEGRRSTRCWKWLHDTYTVVLLHRGGGVIRYRGGEHFVRSGDVLVFEPGAAHVDLRVGRSNDFTTMFLEPDLVTTAQGAARRELPPIRVVSKAASSIFRDGRDLVAFLDGGDPAGSSQLQQFVRTIFDRSADSTSKRAEWHPMVKEALAFARAEKNARASVQKMAAHVGTTTSYLSRVFREQVGVPPHHYLLQLRIARARRLLRGGARAIDVAEALAFGDQSHLHRHFRAIVGVSPGTYAR